jgi:integrase/recombinase XerC
MIGHRITDYLNYIRYEKRYSQHTFKAYEADLLSFKSYVVEQFGIEDVDAITHFHIRSWLSVFKDSGLGSRSINRKLSVVNSFFKFLLKKSQIKKNPAMQLHAVKSPERLPSFVKENEAEYMLEELQFDEGFKGATDRLICELLYQTGMRRSEVIGLKEKDMEWSLKQVRILGKGNKERLVPVSPMLMETIQEYIALKKQQEHYDENHLLMLENGQPLYPHYVYRIVKSYLSDSTTLNKKSPHVLRHSFATHLLNNGANIQAIKDLLGHSSLAATQVYTHNNIEKLKEIHKTNHPRG